MPLKQSDKSIREQCDDLAKQYGLDTLAPNVKAVLDAIAVHEENMKHTMSSIQFMPNGAVSIGYDVPHSDQHKSRIHRIPNSPSTIRQCNHNWKKYIGFKEAYLYCEHCPEKKDLPEESH